MSTPISPTHNRRKSDDDCDEFSSKTISRTDTPDLKPTIPTHGPSLLRTFAMSRSFDLIPSHLHTNPHEARALGNLNETALHWSCFHRGPARNAIIPLADSFPEACGIVGACGRNPLHIVCAGGGRGTVDGRESTVGIVERLLSYNGNMSVLVSVEDGETPISGLWGVYERQCSDFLEEVLGRILYANANDNDRSLVCKEENDLDDNHDTNDNKISAAEILKKRDEEFFSKLRGMLEKRKAQRLRRIFRATPISKKREEEENIISTEKATETKKRDRSSSPQRNSNTTASNQPSAVGTEEYALLVSLNKHLRRHSPPRLSIDEGRQCHSDNCCNKNVKQEKKQEQAEKVVGKSTIMSFLPPSFLEHQSQGASTKTINSPVALPMKSAFCCPSSRSTRPLDVLGVTSRPEEKILDFANDDEEFVMDEESEKEENDDDIRILCVTIEKMLALLHAAETALLAYNDDSNPFPKPLADASPIGGHFIYHPKPSYDYRGPYYFSLSSLGSVALPFWDPIRTAISIRSRVGDLGCPTSFLQLLIGLFPECARKGNDNQYLLHIALREKSIPACVINSILSANPGAAMEFCPSLLKSKNDARRPHRLPLHEALMSGRTYKMGVSSILRANPNALHVRDDETKLYPFMLASGVTSSSKTQNKKWTYGSPSRRVRLVEKEQDIETVRSRYELDQFETTYQLLRESPTLLKG